MDVVRGLARRLDSPYLHTGTSTADVPVACAADHGFPADHVAGKAS